MEIRMEAGACSCEIKDVADDEDEDTKLNDD
jgi:hypothetical protein